MAETSQRRRLGSRQPDPSMTDAQRYSMLGKNRLMNKMNIIGKKIGPETRIYRIFPRDRFLQLFQEDQNALVLPTLWDDPFENAILKAEVRTSTGELGSFSFHGDVYGQCWTLETASDAMWQIYSRNSDAVRVRTTVGRLIESLSASQGDWAHVSCFIGRVDYMSEKRLREFGSTVFKGGVTPEAVARSLLAKRRAYKHENEVRLIYFERSDNKHPKGVFKYALEPRKVIDQVMVDGRVSYNDFLPLKKKIMKLTGFSDQQVRRSLLYRPPDNFVVELSF